MAKDLYQERLASLGRAYSGLAGRNGAQFAKTLDEDVLSSVAYPDFAANPLTHHTEAGEAARNELNARNKPISPPFAIAPGFIGEKDAERVAPKGLRGASRVLRILGALIFWPALLFTFYVGLDAENAREDALARAHAAGVLSDAEYGERNTPIHSPLEPGDHSGDKYYSFGHQFLDRAEVLPYATSYRLNSDLVADGELLLFGAGFVWVMGGVFRAKPARILLLRKFNNIDVDARLRRFVGRNLAPLGYVFVLADKHYKRRLFTFANLFLYWLPTFWGPKLVLIPWDFVRGRFSSASGGGAIRVFNAKGFRRFAQGVAERLSCNAQVISNSRRSIMVRTGDDWWRPAVVLLMQSADMIVVDLSDLTSGTEWELDQLQALNLLDRTVFIVRKDTPQGLGGALDRFDLWRRHGALSPLFWKGLKQGSKEAERAYAQLGFKEGDPAPIVFSNDGRALAPKQLHERMRQALVAGVRAKAQA
jgi:hypothetical protein